MTDPSRVSSRRFTSPRGKKLTGLARKYPLDRAATARPPRPAATPAGRILITATTSQALAAAMTTLARAGHRAEGVVDAGDALRGVAVERLGLIIIAADVDPRETLTLGNLHIDFDAYQVFVGERPVRLTPAEFTTLRTLAEREGRLCTRGSLATTVRGRATTPGVDMRVSRLRRKLGGAGIVIECVRGEGYRLSLARAAAS